MSQPKEYSPQAKEYVNVCEGKKVHPNSALLSELRSGPIRTLDLRRNYVGSDQGFQSVLDFIAKTPTLEVIDLSMNYLTTENVKQLCEVLRKHPSVHTVKLNDNRLYIESGKELVRLARFNPLITEVEVTASIAEGAPKKAISNNIPDKILRQIQACVSYNKQRKQTA